MGVLNSIGSKALNAVGINTSYNVSAPPQPDFTSFDVHEIVDGVEKQLNEDGYGFYLSGPFMPKIPFEFGVTQKIQKDYYPGAPHPTVQVLGPQDDDTTVKGRLKLKSFNRPNVPDDQKISDPKKIAIAYQEKMDEVCRRGNLLKLEMGEWVRFGFLENAKFTLNRLVDIEFELKFSIIGLTKPDGCRATEPQSDDTKSSNNDLIAAAAAAASAIKNYPETMPMTIADLLNSKISDVASVIASVTGFIDGIIDDADQILKSANKAIGLIKYARSYVAKTVRQIGQISFDFNHLGQNFSNESDKAIATIKNAKFINDAKISTFNLLAYLAALQKKFEGIAQTIPKARHLVVDGDTLQKISLKYYGTADSWKKIYDHNGLTSTDLVRGSILEIPR